MTARRNQVIYCGFGRHRDGPAPPLGGFLSGTQMVVDSKRFDHTDFHLNAYTHKGDGGYLQRFFEDLRRLTASLDAFPDHRVVMMQVGQYASTYRESAMASRVRKQGRRLLLDLRGGAVLGFLDRESNWIQRMLFRRMLDASALVLVQCRSFLPTLKRRYPRTRFEWFPNFVCREEIPGSTAAEAAGPPLRLVYFGAYSAAKGLSEMLEAVARCRARGLAVELHLAGAGDDANLAERIRQATDQGVTDHGRLERPALFQLLGRCQALLYPTSHFGEGHSNSVNEAMLHGLAVVATPHQELPHVLPESGTLWLEPERLVDSLVEKIERLTQDSDWLHNAGRANQAHVREHFSDANWITQLEAWFDELASG